ncbi:restriction endonuclease subunit S [Chryseobacterium suipulveris]|uniref:Restriction endonuclease subunit S n=1 Tax=Chryseobacterium suipulveris TaxID=2929800 RepID=A0ABY4BW88_9FLAO|nr:restriction endonuclease subunit S [Chryseobacterium suipulveris]UOE42136.1 restriction endonuclease subunit S [Chryseobacterium suipulveris]
MRYAEYKKVDIDWVNEIPRHWETKMFKGISYMKGRIGWQGLKFSEFSDDVNLPYLITGMNFKDGKIRWNEVYHISEERYNEAPEIQLQENDILMTKDGTIGKLLFVENLPGKASLNSHLLLLRPLMKSYFPKFLYYELQSSVFLGHIEYFKYGTTFYGLSQESMGKFVTVLPPLKEQQSIAHYLERKTAAIDRKTEILQHKIDTYRQLRKAIINNAVTKGLNPNAEMKDSEIGLKVPAHWLHKRLKDIGNLYSGLSGKSGDDFNQDDNVDNKGFIPFTNIANNIYLDKNHLGTVVVYPGENQNEVKKGDLFFLMSSEGYEDIGKTAVLANDIPETYLNSFCKGFRINLVKYNPNFLNYLLLSDFYRKRMTVEGKGFTRINLKMEKVSNFQVFIPKDKKEQSEIAEYLDKKTATIDRIVANLQEQIATLKNLRKTLINDAVTGKIKVV